MTENRLLAEPTANSRWRSAFIKSLLIVAIVAGYALLAQLAASWFHVLVFIALTACAPVVAGWLLGRPSGISAGLLVFGAVTVLFFLNENLAAIIPPFHPARIIGLILLSSLGYGGGWLRDLRTDYLLATADRLRAETAVGQWADIFQRIELGVVVCSGEQPVMQRMNPAFAKMLGHSVEELTGTSIVETFAPEEHAKLVECIRITEQEGFHTFESQLIRQDETRLPVLVQASAVKDDEGKLLYRTASIIDIRDRKQAEETVQKREKLYRDAIASADAVAYQIDFATDAYIHIDEGIERLIGYRAEEVTKELWHQVIEHHEMFGEAAGLTSRGATKLYRDGKIKVWKADYLCRIKDGQERWLSDSSIPICDANGSVQGCLGILQDITERKRVEEALRMTQFGIDNSSDGAFWIQSDAQFTYVNDAACLSLGYSREELLTMKVFDIDPEFPAERWNKFWQQTRQQERITFESNHQAKNGRIFPVEIIVSLLEFRGQEYLYAFARDITARKEAEQKLRESEEKLRTVFDNVPDFIVQVNRHGEITFINRILPDFLEHEVLGKDIYRFLSAEAVPMAKTVLEKVFQTGQTQAFEIPGYGEGGDTSWYSGRFAPIIRDGEVISAICIATDITDRKNAEGQVRRHQGELAHVARLATMGEMVTGLAHELNQPLTAVVNSAHACQQALDSNGSQPIEKITKLVTGISDQAHRAGEIIRRLRAFTKKSEPHRESVDVNSLVHDVVSLVKAEADLHGISLHLQLADSLPEVIVDRIQIEQVAINLIKNAFDTFLESDISPREVTIRTLPSEKEGVEVVVTDNGQGLTENQSSRVFEPFYTTKQHGMGMGLAISRTIVETHGGRIWTNSKTNNGAAFHFSLPRQT